jgi:hypothetical protein
MPPSSVNAPFGLARAPRAAGAFGFAAAFGTSFDARFTVTPRLTGAFLAVVIMPPA